ncbi:unnamed protein product [Arctogadus glacialis]
MWTIILECDDHMNPAPHIRLQAQRGMTGPGAPGGPCLVETWGPPAGSKLLALAGASIAERQPVPVPVVLKASFVPPPRLSLTGVFM